MAANYWTLTCRDIPLNVPYIWARTYLNTPSHKVCKQKHGSYISLLRRIFTFEFQVRRPQFHHSLANSCIRYMCSIFFWKLIQARSLFNISQQLLAPLCLISRSIDWQRQERLLKSFDDFFRGYNLYCLCNQVTELFERHFWNWAVRSLCKHFSPSSYVIAHCKEENSQFCKEESSLYHIL